MDDANAEQLPIGTGMANPTARAAVGSVVFDEQGRILLVRRAPDAVVGAGEWGFPGGRIDAGETIVRAGSRETTEETGVSVLDPRLMTTITEDLFWGPEQHFVTHYVVSTKWTGVAAVMEPHKHSEILWIRPRDLIKALMIGEMPCFGPLKAFVASGGLCEAADMIDDDDTTLPYVLAMSVAFMIMCLSIYRIVSGADGWFLTVTLMATAVFLIVMCIKNDPFEGPKKA